MRNFQSFKILNYHFQFITFMHNVWIVTDNHSSESIKTLKVVSATFVLVCFLSLNESTCQTRKNVIYFTSKALFVLEKIEF